MKFGLQSKMVVVVALFIFKKNLLLLTNKSSLYLLSFYLAV